MNKVMLILTAVCLLLSGCTEAEKQPVWGKGELSAEWVEMFGDDNQSRLAKSLFDIANKQELVLRGTNQKTPDGEVTHLDGVIDIVLKLDARAKALEAVDPNEVAEHIHPSISLTYPEKEGMVRYIFTDPSGEKGRLEVHNGNEWVVVERPEAKRLKEFNNYSRLQTDWNSDIAAKINEIIDRVNGGDAETSAEWNDRVSRIR